MKTQNTENQQVESLRPTKERPLFTAECDYFGYISDSIYKNMDCTSPCGEYGSSMATFATSLPQAIHNLHRWIAEHPWVVDEYPKAKFNVYVLDGSWNSKNQRMNERKMYSISAKDAKSMIIDSPVIWSMIGGKDFEINE